MLEIAAQVRMHVGEQVKHYEVLAARISLKILSTAQDKAARHNVLFASHFIWAWFACLGLIECRACRAPCERRDAARKWTCYRLAYHWPGFDGLVT
jgi:hypothetical protein